MPTLHERPMTRLSAALSPKRAPTPAEAEAIAFVRDLAIEWDADRLPMAEVRALTNGPKRWLATRFTPPDHDAFPALMRMLDELIEEWKPDRNSEVLTTKHGQFTKQEIIDAEVRIEREDGKELLCFPYLYTWLTKPDPEKGIEGVRGPALYRSKEQRGPTIGSFSVKPPAPKKSGDVPWWEEAGDE